MDDFINVISKIWAQKEVICNIIAYVIAIASIIVKITPTLKDDAYLKTIIKFIGKYLALDKYPCPSSK